MTCHMAVDHLAMQTLFGLLRHAMMSGHVHVDVDVGVDVHSAIAIRWPWPDILCTLWDHVEGGRLQLGSWEVS